MLLQECSSIYKQLHRFDRKRHQHDLARSLHYLSWHLQRARDFDLAEPIAQEAVILRRQLHKAQPKSNRLRTDLSQSLNNYASALRNVGNLDGAHAAKKEATTLRGKAFLTEAECHPSELNIFAHAMGAHMFQQDTTDSPSLENMPRSLSNVGLRA